MKFIFTNVSWHTMDSFGFETNLSEYDYGYEDQEASRDDYENIVLDYLNCEIIQITRGVHMGSYDIEFLDGHKLHEVGSEFIKMVEI